MLDQYKSTISTLANEFPLIGQALLHHTNTRGEPMSFRDFPYLIPLYDRLYTSKGADIRKGVQTGLSELLICLSLYQAGWEGKIVAYILPTFSIRDRFVNQRINKVILSNEVYKSHLPSTYGTGNNRTKRFGSGSMLFLGSNTTVDFVEFSADTMIVDEFDQCDPDNLAKAKDRIRASRDPRMFRIGNPTLPNTGICQLFDKSNQHHWFTPCPHCKHWQCLDWEKHIVQKNDRDEWVPRDPNALAILKTTKPEHLKYQILPVCEKCHKPFQRQSAGDWVPIYPEIERDGFTISRLDVLTQSLTDLYQEWTDAQHDTSRLSTFYTSVLGKGFEFSGSRITAEMISACSTGEALDYGGEIYEDELVSMGVDVGSVLNVVISKQKINAQGEAVRESLLIIAVKFFEELKDLAIRFNVSALVIDSMPETRKCQELRDWGVENGINVWLCRFYPTPRIADQRYGRKLDWRKRVVTVDRTQIMDATFDEYKNTERIIPFDSNSVLGFYAQMKAPVRVIDQNKSRIVWHEGNAPDHFRFADVYDRIAFDMLQMSGSYSSL